MTQDRIILAHGSGGRLTHELIQNVFARHLRNPLLDQCDDAAVWTPTLQVGERLALTTDSYVVRPIFFPGGDIGKLAVCGTVNDLAMVGAVPLYLSAGFILEEGLPLADLERIVISMAHTAQEVGVQIVTGDTKVVDKGSADLIFINTAGIGLVPAGFRASGASAYPGDAVILSGAIGAHGVAIMSQREGLCFSFPLESDCAPLGGLVAEMLQADTRIHCMRDPTRGGLATTLNEIAGQSHVGIDVEEAAIPVPEAVKAACDLLGLDPLYVANEGKLVAVVAPEAVSAVLQVMRRHPYGAEATVIGHVSKDRAGQVVLHTTLGARRILDMLSGAQLPRIC